jgi:hypothetical protein
MFVFFISVMLFHSTQNIVVLLFLLTMTNWVLARYCSSINIWFEIDIFTIYLFLWQLVYSICNWVDQSLPYISFTLHQILSCLYMSFLSYMLYDIILQYFSAYINFGYLWITSIVDM